MMIPTSLGSADSNLCSRDTSLWVTMKSMENGRCYHVCTADPNQMFEVSCPEGLETAGLKKAVRAETDRGGPLSGQTIIKGVPNWAVIAGAAVIGIILVNG